jgi:hypothetical protein
MLAAHVAASSTHTAGPTLFTVFLIMGCGFTVAVYVDA